MRRAQRRARRWTGATGDGRGRTGGTDRRTGRDRDNAGRSGGDPNVQSTIEPLRVPAVSVDVALPWFTGQPYALYAHVRAITEKGPTGWSTPFAFNMRWPSVPTPLPTQPGLVRWGSVSGATGYQVWYPDVQKVFSVHTNVADLREFYTFHTLVHDREVARACRAPRLRNGAERPPGRLVRPVEPDLHGLESDALERQPARRRSRSPIGSATGKAVGARAHARPRLQRQPGAERRPRRRSSARTHRPIAIASTSSTRARSSAARRSHRARPARSGSVTAAWAAAQPRSPSRTRSRTGRRVAKEWSNDWRPIVSNEVALGSCRWWRGGAALDRSATTSRPPCRHPRRPAGHRLPDDALLLDGRARHLEGQRLGSAKSRLVGHRDAAGCLRRGPRRELRQGERAGRDR